MFPIRDSVRSESTPVITRGLVLVNALVFLMELTFRGAAREKLFYLFGIVPARFTHPGWAEHVGFPAHHYLPLFTHQFLHGGWLHIISNMWALWIFGDNVEDRMGSFRFLIFYLLCGVAAGLTQMFSNPNSTIPSVGASGAIAGVFGAYLLQFPRARVEVVMPIWFYPFFFELPAVLYLGFWFLSQLFSGTMALANPNQVGGIAWWAHVGGFVVGMLLCPIFVKKRRKRPFEDEGF
jgi:membrane associated rhomboid family serine protease